MLIPIATAVLLSIAATTSTHALRLPSGVEIAIPKAIPLFEVDAVELPVQSEPNFPVGSWSCEVRAWVRAPDLQPLLVSSADARLLLNGTGCEDIVKWEVGLEYKERSIVKILVENATLPAMPVWNETWSDGLWEPHNGIYDSGWSHLREDRKLNPYDEAMKAYAEEVSNPALWQVEGRERLVFNSRVELVSSRSPDGSIPLESVRSFALAVPNVNFPPSLGIGNVHYSSGDAEHEFSASETSFEYVAYLTLRNGTTLEYPAGKTVFVPGPSAPLPQTSPKDVQVVLEPSSADHMRWIEPSAIDTKCERDNTTAFEVTVELPSTGTHFVQGTHLLLNATIRRLHSRVQAPTYISFTPTTSTENTWASTFGRNSTEKDRLKHSNTGGGWTEGNEESSLQERALPVKSAAEEAKYAEDQEKGMESPWMMMARYGREGRGAKFGTKLIDEDLQSVLVNFTVPWNTMPTFNSTFTSFLSYIRIKLETSQVCSPANGDIIPALDDLKDDEAWSPYPSFHRRSRSTRTPLKSTHRGNINITIVPTPSTTSSSQDQFPISYLSSSAQAPQLLGSVPEGGDQTPFPLVGSELRKEVLDSELQKGRYDRRSNRIRRGRSWKGDGSWGFVGQIWERKLRRELDLVEALRRQSEKEPEAFVIQG